tara:strand:+ start:24231 stop:24506 length:276 start_codon:yes stop_codon:yes gene_type:complete
MILSGIQSMVAELLVYAVKDYRRLKACKGPTIRLDGARATVEVELEKLRSFFLDGGADAYLEFLGSPGLTGELLWSRLERGQGGAIVRLMA